jgi:hypothetical protein
MAISAETRKLEQAFISPNIISVDDTPMDGVVTAYRWPDGSLIIMIRPVEPPAALASLRITIDERDLGEVQKLVGEQRQLVIAPEEDLDALGMALTALHQIADLDQAKTEDEKLSWKDVAMRCIDYAQEALVEIDLLEEGEDGTSSDS